MKIAWANVKIGIAVTVYFLVFSGIACDLITSRPAGENLLTNKGSFSTAVPVNPNDAPHSEFSGHGDLSGTLTVAVNSVNSPNGLPRFCTSGRAETIYASGITDVLFNSVVKNDVLTTEPMLALSYEMEPGLDSAVFKLREGVQFHRGYGEMTADDVKFSYDDANSTISPKSIHGQADDFAALIQEIEVVDDYTLKVNHRNYDSRGPLHRFSLFWKTAGIVSSAVFREHGLSGMQNVFVGVGAFTNEEWSQGGKIVGHAFVDYWGGSLGQGPFVEKVIFLEVPEPSSRAGLLETGEVQIAQVQSKDYSSLMEKGFLPNKDAQHNLIHNVSMVGNYWEKYSSLDESILNRRQDTSLPWIGNPFENGSYDENSSSMVNSRKVRNALAWSVDRQELLDTVLNGFGYVNHQPYLSVNNTNYIDGWSWGLDYEKARNLLKEAGYRGGFSLDIWTGPSGIGSEVGESLGRVWQENLGISVNLVDTNYEVYRPGLIARTSKLPGINTCREENHSNFPYDWAHGFDMSSFSTRRYGAGQEIPYATKTFKRMSGELDIDVRKRLAAEFFTNNRVWANCFGIFEEQLWPFYDPENVVDWDQRPTAIQNLGGINNIRTVELK